jgi:hypothetical protein
MSEEPESFIDYWDAVDAALLRFFGIDTSDTEYGRGRAGRGAGARLDAGRISSLVRQ